MAVEWFYTTNKQQMGPVTWTELRELAEGGILKPHDLVWSDGMDEWVKAISQKGLFADGGVEEAAPVGKKSSYTETKPPPGRRTRRKDDDEDEEDEEDSKEAKRKARKKREENAKMAVGMKVGLILAGVVAVLFFLGCTGGLLVWMAWRGNNAPPKGNNAPPRVNNPPPNGNNPPPNNGPARVRDNYTVFNLNQGGRNSRFYNFTQGRRVVITVTNNLANPNTDVDLHVFQGNNPVPFIVDVRTPPIDRNCRVDFIVPANDRYRVEIFNLGPGRANSCVVSVEEQ